MKMMRNLRGSLLRSERKEIIPSPRRWRAWAYAPIAAIFMVLLAVRSTTFADSATWVGGDPDCPDCFEYQFNWIPPTFPNGPAFIAIFDVSNITTPTVDDSNVLEVNSIVFNSGASAFTIGVSKGGSFGFASLTISGAGVTNNSGLTQNFEVGDPQCFFCETNADLIFTIVRQRAN
jgi:hypothetical protein